MGRNQKFNDSSTGEGVKLLVVNNWLGKVNKDERKENWSINLVEKLVGNNIGKYPNGKPFILNEKEFINWSHNDTYLVIALSDLGQVGVDIESMFLPYDEHLYGWVLHKEEKYKLEQGRLFSEVWTRKEAVLKYTGEGIHDNMDTLNSYKVTDLNITTLYLKELCISVCSRYKEDIEIQEIF